MGHRLYISGAGAIHLCEMDPSSGDITVAQANVGSGAFIAPSADGRFLYALEGEGATAYSIAADGTLLRLNTAKAELSGFAHISTTGTAEDGNAVCLLAAYGGGGVSILNIYRDGSLADSAPGSSFAHGPAGSLVDPLRQAKSCAHSGFVDPTGSRVLISDLGTDQVVAYAIDGTAGSLACCAVFDSAPGAGERAAPSLDHPNPLQCGPAGCHCCTCLLAVPQGHGTSAFTRVGSGSTRSTSSTAL
jgi:6-phosphogluconolactonase (cycloisomerase 2 family)